ncbi:MAG TPA: DUF3450 domain-containing protein [Verrucomicrobiae bacterium]|nr:DUF3450 domain-containing protein [Verrucomicrobiae bacterium]
MTALHARRPAARRSAMGLVAAMVCILALLPVDPARAADEVGEALEASLSSQRAARESQQRVNKFDDEAKVLRDKRRTAQWKALQQSAYAAQLEEQAAIEEKKRGELESQLARIASTGTDLAPLMARMVAELETFIEADLPFLREARRQRVADLKALLADPTRGGPEKFRRVLEAHRSEVEYGHSIGAEDREVDCAGARGKATLVRVGRIGLYCLTPDGTGGYWDARHKRFETLDDDGVAELRRAVVVARGDGPPELLVLPVRAGRE